MNSKDTDFGDFFRAPASEHSPCGYSAILLNSGESKMFIGHYGVAFAAKPIHRPIPLWLLFVAVQWLDFWWSAFVLLGVEKVRITPGFTEASPLDLYYMPYSHSLLGAIFFSTMLGGVSAAFFRSRSMTVCWIVGLAAFSHWLLDFISHGHDLPLLGESVKVGLGLRNHLWFNLAVEIGSLLLGAFAYARYARAARRIGDLLLWLFVSIMAAMEAVGELGPAPASVTAQAFTAPSIYLALALCAGFVDWMRSDPSSGLKMRS